MGVEAAVTAEEDARDGVQCALPAGRCQDLVVRLDDRVQSEVIGGHVGSRRIDLELSCGWRMDDYVLKEQIQLYCEHACSCILR